MAVILPMFIFALIGAISPGPVNIIATGSGASFGFKRTLPHIFGATIAYTLIVLLVGLGFNHWLEVYPQITQSLQYIGSAFLLFMSYKIATALPLTSSKADNFIPPSSNIDPAAKSPPSLIQGALAQGLNPKAWMVSMSGVSLFVSSQVQAPLYLAIFCVISFSVCFIGIATWAALGHNISRLLSTQKRQVTFNLIMALLLSATVMSILFGS